MNAQKSLFDRGHCYTMDAMLLESSAMRLLVPLFGEYLKKGYSPREISHILSGAVRDLKCESLLTTGCLADVLQRIAGG